MDEQTTTTNTAAGNTGAAQPELLGKIKTWFAGETKIPGTEKKISNKILAAVGGALAGLMIVKSRK